MISKSAPAPTYARLDAEQIAGLASMDFTAKHAVINGGEPCLRDLRPLCAELFAYDFEAVQVETSGTEKIQAPGRAWVTVSPKIGMPGSKAPREDALERADEIKMIVGKPADIDYAREHLAPVAVRNGKALWLQPLFGSPVATRLCVDAATKHGWRVSPWMQRLEGLR